MLINNYAMHFVSLNLWKSFMIRNHNNLNVKYHCYFEVLNYSPYSLLIKKPYHVSVSKILIKEDVFIAEEVKP